MKSALVMAEVIYDDITMLNVTSWQHWIAVSEVDYCDGLIYINLDTKTYEMTKRYYATGNFSKYIPYKANRIEAVCEDKELKVLAFEKDKKTVVIIINATEAEKTVDIPCSTQVKLVVTNNSENLTETTVNSKEIKITPRSVNTIIF